MSSDKVGTIAAEIIDYLRNNASAADTVAGITQWWQLKSAVSQTEVVEALRRLQGRGIVVCTDSAARGAGIWRLSDSAEKNFGTQQKGSADKGTIRRRHR